MEIHAKVWLTHDGKMVISRGRAQLLEAVEATGSISAAARDLDMSYRHAWSMLRASEEHLGRPLLEKRKGGARGGGARLTPDGRQLLRKYRELEARLQALKSECLEDV
jgi:molybdate transport system regulatory protein